MTAIASPIINIIEVELVGAKLFGHASIGFLYMIPALILHIYFPAVVLLGMFFGFGLLLLIYMRISDQISNAKSDDISNANEYRQKFLISGYPAVMATLCLVAFMSIHFTRQYYVPPPHEGSEHFNRNYRYLMRSGFAQLIFDGPNLANSFSWPSGIPVIKIKSRILTHQYFNSLVSRLHRIFHKLL